LTTTRPVGPTTVDGSERPPHPAGKVPPNATAASRVLAVLDAFGPSHAALTLSEISRRSGLSLTTTHRLVGELRAWGALERGSDGRYGIGLRLLELGALAPHGLQLREVATPYVDDLHQATRANVVLGVRDGSDVVYVEALRARGAVKLMSRIGGRWPLHTTGTGLVLLAFAAPEVQEGVLSAPLRRYTPDTVTDPAVLRRTLAEVRRTGVGIAENQLAADAPAMAVAVPVRGAGDEVVAALGVTVEKGTVQAQALLPVLNATARSISRALGAPSARPTLRSGRPAP
jgi:DNA-binding IclR family transcriptional regulator